MTREDAFELLNSPSSHERFKAVRALESTAIASDINALLMKRAIENDFLVKKRLGLLIDSLNAKIVAEPQPDEQVSPEVKAKIRGEALEWISGLLLHEIGSKIGLLATAIAQEIPTYGHSQSKRRIENLQNTFDGIGELRKATSLPHPSEFDLATYIKDLISLEEGASKVEILTVGRQPLMVFSDKSLLGLAITNGIKNAIEASLLVSETVPPNVIVNWGITDKDYWVSIVDRGPGLPGHSSRSFNLGESTKDGHLGFGLGISKQAMETLRGSVTLSNSEPNGAVYELRWSL